MREIVFTNPDQPGVKWPVEVPDGADVEAVKQSVAEEGWVAEETTEAEAEVTEVPVGDSINLTPEPAASQAAPAEPETDQPTADTTKEK